MIQLSMMFSSGCPQTRRRRFDDCANHFRSASLLVAAPFAQLALQKRSAKHVAAFAGHNFAGQYAGDNLGVILVSRARTHHADVKYLETLRLVGVAFVANENDVATSFPMDSIAGHDNGTAFLS